MREEIRVDLCHKFGQLWRSKYIIPKSTGGDFCDLWAKAKRMEEVFKNSWGIDEEEHAIVMEILSNEYTEEGLQYFNTPFHYIEWYKTQQSNHVIGELGT